jgi:two-component sensor histidine kinase
MDAWWNAPGTRHPDWLTYLLAAASVGALAAGSGLGLRGRALGPGGAGPPRELLNLPTMVALYTVAVQGGRRRTVIVGVVAALWSVGLAELFDDQVVGTPMLEILWPQVPLLLGEVVRGRRELLGEYAARAAFHDVVAHTMAAVNVHMGVAVTAFESRPDTARRALHQARASSREALQELRAAVALLRDASVADSAAPAPTLDGLAEMAEGARRTGMAVTLTRDTDGAEVPAVVEVTAYRIVQEALTNVLRHANAEHAHVVVTVDGGALVVDVCDDGRPPAPPPAARRGSGEGFGLVGMTERVAALDGHLEFGPRPGGGFNSVDGTSLVPLHAAQIARWVTTPT